MTDQTQTIRETAAKPTKTCAPPRILSRERLEAVAGLCSTGKTNFSDCPSGPIAS